MEFMQQLFDIFKAKENKIYGPHFFINVSRQM